MKKGFLLISMIVLISTLFAFNPLNYIPADVDAAFEVTVPEQLLTVFGLDIGDLLEETGEFLNPDIEVKDMQAILFGKFGVNAYLFDAIDFDYLYDVTDITDFDTLISAIAEMPAGVITNVINMNLVFGFLEGEAMHQAVDMGVHYEILTEEVAGYSVKHFKIRFYDDYEPVFFDLYFTELEAGYYLAATDYELLESSLLAAKDETMRLVSFCEDMGKEDYFAKLQNNTFDLSAFLIRAMNIFNGEPDSEFCGIGVNGTELYLNFNVDMKYISDKFQKNTEIYKTDREFFNAMPSFDFDYPIDNFLSIPKIGLPADLIGELMYELPMLETYSDTLENYFEILPLMGPELERVNICYSDEGYMPYMLAKCSDAKLIFDNIVELYDIETATVGYIEYSYGDDVYIAYDSRYDYIEIYAFDLAEFVLRQGELLFTEKLKSDSEPATYVQNLPDYLWGTVSLGDFIEMTVEFNEAGDLSFHFSFDLSEITEMIADIQREEALSEIVNLYERGMYYINDQLTYYPEDELSISQMMDELEYYYSIDPERLKAFKVSIGTSGDKPVYNLYYGGVLPEGTTVEDLRQAVENIVYAENVTVEIRGDVVLMRLFTE